MLVGIIFNTIVIGYDVSLFDFDSYNRVMFMIVQV